MRRGRTPELSQHLLTGIEGEEVALLYLLGKGYTVVARRWSAGNLPGDLDLVAWQGPKLCFCEIKSRTTRDPNPAEATIDRHKRNLLRRLARQYLRQLGVDAIPQTRFDTIGIYMESGKTPGVEHVEDAFGWFEDGIAPHGSATGHAAAASSGWRRARDGAV